MLPVQGIANLPLEMPHSSLYVHYVTAYATFLHMKPALVVTAL